MVKTDVDPFKSLRDPHRYENELLESIDRNVLERNIVEKWKKREESNIDNMLNDIDHENFGIRDMARAYLGKGKGKDGFGIRYKKRKSSTKKIKRNTATTKKRSYSKHVSRKVSKRSRNRK